MRAAAWPDAMTLTQFEAPEGLRDIVARFWLVAWDMAEGEVFQQSNLPHPVCHVVVDPQRGSGLFGCSTGRFDYQISGKGAVLGARFHVGGACAVYDRALVELADRSVGFEVPEGLPSGAMVSDLGLAIESVRGALSEGAVEARKIVEMIDATPELLRVADVAVLAGVSVRQLQRLFAAHVGVSPKWVIERYRMFEAVAALEGADAVSLADLSVQLGYSDQAHFNKQFKRITGISPGAYRAQGAL
ncbi:MAG: helix-turn-helix domain-containing protein [Paracoccaceae bacterium]